MALHIRNFPVDKFADTEGVLILGDKCSGMTTFMNAVATYLSPTYQEAIVLARPRYICQSRDAMEKVGLQVTEVNSFEKAFCSIIAEEAEQRASLLLINRVVDLPRDEKDKLMRPVVQRLFNTAFLDAKQCTILAEQDAAEYLGDDPSNNPFRFVVIFPCFDANFLKMVVKQYLRNIVTVKQFQEVLATTSKQYHALVIDTEELNGKSSNNFTDATYIVTADDVLKEISRERNQKMSLEDVTPSPPLCISLAEMRKQFQESKDDTPSGGGDEEITVSVKPRKRGAATKKKKETTKKNKNVSPATASISVEE